MPEKTIDLHIDYKSPYAYLAVEPAWTLERDFRVRLNWLPYTLDNPDVLASARVDEGGRVIAENRSAHQWRRVRYAYMDVRRYANLRGLTVRGPRKIWDSSLAGIGLLYAKERGVFPAYNAIVYERFWRRELDIEKPEVIEGVLAEAGADVAGFQSYARGEGRRLHDRVRASAEEAGVFGVPTFVLDGEIFFGREHLALIGMRLVEQGLRRADAGPLTDATYAWRRGAPGV